MRAIAKFKILSDPCLIHQQWLEITLISSLKELDFINNFMTLQKLITKKCVQDKIKQACINIPVHWHLAKKFLFKLKWRKSLMSVELNLKNYKPFANLNSFIKINQNSFEDIKNLLRDQAKYHNDHYGHYYKKSNNINWRDYEKSCNFFDIKKNLEPNDKSMLFSYELEDRPIGILIAEINKKKAHIFELVVSQEHRGKKIGKHLLQAVINFSIEKNIDMIYAQTWWNQPAKNLYLREKFIEKFQEYYLPINC